MIDYTDSEQLNQFAYDTVRLSMEYLVEQKKYSKAKAFLHVKLAESYHNGDIAQSMAAEKAMMMLSTKSDNFKQAYEAYTVLDGECKGLKEVIEARKAYTSLAQSLIKNKIQEGG